MPPTRFRATRAVAASSMAWSRLWREPSREWKCEQDYPGDDRRAWSDGRGIPEGPRDSRPRAKPPRARYLLGHVVRALLLQVIEEVAEDTADRRPPCDPRPGRECGRGRPWGGAGGRLQDRKPQSPQLHRTLSGRSHRRRWYPAGRLHHGRPPGDEPERPALRQPRPPQNPPPGLRRGGWYRRLRKLRRHPDRRGGTKLPPRLQRQHSRQCNVRRSGPGRPHLLLRRGRARETCRLRRIEDGARRYSRGDHGLRGVRRRKRGKAADGPGW